MLPLKSRPSPLIGAIPPVRLADNETHPSPGTGRIAILHGSIFPEAK